VAQSISATVKDLTQRRSASAAEFDEDSIDEGKGCERAALVGLINPVAGRATFECVIHKMLRRAIPVFRLSLCRWLSVSRCARPFAQRGLRSSF